MEKMSLNAASKLVKANYPSIIQQFIKHPKLVVLCQSYHVQRLAIFGSAIRDDFTSTSDVDLLVEFEAGYTPGLAFFSLEKALSDLLGRSVDLNTWGWISPYLHPQIQAEAQVIYEQA
jgi:predicted nucleotidyltransferase